MPLWFISAARRQTDDAEEARDIGQMVFADLARKAGSIPANLTPIDLAD